jgi:hypothetical protein
LKLTDEQIKSIRDLYIKDLVCYSTNRNKRETLLSLLDTIETLQRENEQLQAQVARMLEALSWLKSISFSREDDLNVWPSQETREMIDAALSDAPVDYHNPADVEALEGGGQDDKGTV